MTGLLYGVLINDAVHTLDPYVGPVTRQREHAIQRAEDAMLDAPAGLKVTPVTIVPGIIPPRTEEKRLYLAGPMTGYPAWNFPAFHESAKVLRAAGYDVVNPAELDEEINAKSSTLTPEEWTRDLHIAAIRRDVLAVLDVDGVAVLPGWEASKGARAEVAVAAAVGTPTRAVIEWVHLARDPELHEEVAA